MMIDKIFRDSPLWLDRLFEKLDGHITLTLKRESQLYRMYKNQMESLYDEYPAFVDIIEGAEEYKPMLLNEEETGKLSQLFQLENDLMEMHERAMYILGVRDGIEIGKLFANFGEEL